MEQKQKNSWGDKPQVIKGNIGERIVLEFLTQQNFVVYKPTDGQAHKIDYFAHNGKQKRVIAVEAKTKKRMATKPKTGFNTNALEHYREIEQKHNIPTFVFFIDDFEMCVYGQWLSKLTNPETINNVTVWLLDEMKFIRWLTESEIKELQQFGENKTYNYKNTIKFFKKNLYLMFFLVYL